MPLLLLPALAPVGPCPIPPAYSPLLLPLACLLQTASSLTLKVLGTVKNALVVCLGIALLSEQVTRLQVRGCTRMCVRVCACVWGLGSGLLCRDGVGSRVHAVLPAQAQRGDRGSPPTALPCCSPTHAAPSAATASTPRQGVGYGLSVAAFFWYQRIKMQQIAQEQGSGSRAAGTAGNDSGGGNGGGGEGAMRLSPAGSLPQYHTLPYHSVPSSEPGQDSLPMRELPDKN